MGKYIVREGEVFGAAGQYKAGDVVELSDAEYVGLEKTLAPIQNYNMSADDGDTSGAKAEKVLVTNPATPAEKASEDAPKADDDDMAKYAKKAGVDAVADTAFLSDAALTEKGLGKRAIKALREKYPYAGE
jgi:hypothetical protein